MLISLADLVAERIAEMSCRPWSPIGRRVWLRFDDPLDASLVEVTVYGHVRAISLLDDLPSHLLIDLEIPLRFSRRPNDAVNWLVTRPCLKWRRTARIRYSWSAVRIIAAPSFADAEYGLTVGVGAVGLA